MSDSVSRIVDELVNARGACAMREVVERHIAGGSRSERERIAAKARRHARVLGRDPEARTALEDFAAMLERESVGAAE